MNNSKTKRAIQIICVFFLIIIFNTSSKAQERINITYIKIEVDGLSCPFCAYGLEKELKKIAGSDSVMILLKEGEAIMKVPNSQIPTKESLEKIVIDAGFTPRGITFSKITSAIKEE